MMGLSNITFILPEIFLVVTAMGFLFAGILQGNKSTEVLCWSAIMAFFIAAAVLLFSPWEPKNYALSNMLVFDTFSGVMRLTLLLAMVISAALCVQYLYQERIARFEYPVLLMFAGIGMLFMLLANNMLALYMGLELHSLCLYILCAFYRTSARAGEAATKYFILGALASGLMLFGMSLIYGFTGSLDFVLIAKALGEGELIAPGFTVGMVFVLVALAFKISAAPFHMWTPDVYQGAPTAVSAFFAIAPKIAVFGVLMRLLFGPFAPAVEQWEQVLYVLSIASLLVGSFGGLAQTSLKRLMAYSSINHIGIMLIGLVCASQAGVSAVILYLFIYLAMNAGVFAIILCLRKDSMALDDIHALSGLSVNHPVLAYALAILMFALSGLPPFAGFFGKLFIFNAAIAGGYPVLAVLGVLTSVVAAFYYLRIVKVMFFDPPADTLDDDIGIEKRLVLIGSIVVVVGFIFVPNTLIAFANSAAASLF